MALVPTELNAAKFSKARGLKHCQAKLRKFRLFCVLQNGTKGCSIVYKGAPMDILPQALTLDTLIAWSYLSCANSKCLRAGGLRHCQAELRTFGLFCMSQNGTKGCNIVYGASMDLLPQTLTLDT